MLKALLLLAVSLDLVCAGQRCSEQREALRVLRQLQKLLTDQEATYLRGIRTLSRRLHHLRGQLQRGESRGLDSESCPALKPPRHGRMLGAKLKVGHEVHFLCDPGYHLLGSQTRTCRENRTWSGQPASCADSPSDTTALRPAKCSSVPGAQHCTCEPGFMIQPGGVCQDIDECGLFPERSASKICVHECVNTPGSYQCVCPQGYLLDSAQNRCQDIDECVSDPGACAGGQTCVNQYGGFTCVRPECPKTRQNTTYLKTSDSQCERSPCPVGSASCLEAPHSISFHHIAIQSQLPVPRVLFTMTGSHSSGEGQRFTITRGKGHRGLEVRQAGRHRGELVLTRALSGPLELRLEVEMAEVSPQGLLGKHVFTLTLYVSQYPF